MKLYQAIANKLFAIDRCEASGNWEWKDNHSLALDALIREFMPSGLGVDCGTVLDVERTKPERLVFSVDFHHMDEHGGYDGWTSHYVTVKPSLVFGFTVDVSGPNRNEIKDYLTDLFQSALAREI